MKPKMMWSTAALLAATGFSYGQDSTMQSAAASQPAGIQPASLTNGSCNSCDTCGVNWNAGQHRNRGFYASFDYLLWRVGSTLTESGSQTLPSIRSIMPYGFVGRSIVTDAVSGAVTTGDVVNYFGLATIDPVLFSGSNIDVIDRSGGRLTFGMTVGNGDWSFEGSFFKLEQRGAQFVASANGLVEGFAAGLQDVEIGPPDPVTGVRPRTTSPTIYNIDLSANIVGNSISRIFGGELNLKRQNIIIGNFSFHEIYGVKFINYDERQTLNQQLALNNPVYIGGFRDLGAGDVFVPGIQNYTNLVGAYAARNQMYAAQVGAGFESEWGRLFWKGHLKLAFGAVRQETIVDEFVFTTETTALLDGTPANTVPFTTYPNPTSFRGSRTRMAWSPEVATSIGYHLTDSIDIFAGYQWIYINRIQRAGGNGLPANGSGVVTFTGAASPGPALTNFQETHLWLHGLNLGLSINF